jgi:hypothetical protein
MRYCIAGASLLWLAGWMSCTDDQRTKTPDFLAAPPLCSPLAATLDDVLVRCAPAPARARRFASILQGAGA